MMPERRYGNIIFLPNKFDDCPFIDAMRECENHFQDRLSEIQARRVNEGWSEKRWESEVRHLADESYSSRQPDE